MNGDEPGQVLSHGNRDCSLLLLRVAHSTVKTPREATISCPTRKCEVKKKKGKKSKPATRRRPRGKK